MRSGLSGIQSTTLTHFSCCSGIDGFSIAAEQAGFKTVGQCEIADYPYQVLCLRWPDVPKWRDIKDVTAESVRARGIQSITLLTAGFPCQPHSLAGKRQASADSRDLWSEVARTIREIGPKWFVGENVPGILSSEDGRYFGRILRDLAEMGYHAGWGCWGAVHIGAFHRRERIFIVAHSPSERLDPSDQKTGTSYQTSFETACKGMWKLKYFRGSSGRIWIAPESIFERVDYGVPGKLDRLKALGNAVDPRQVYPLLQAIADLESQS